MNAALTNVRHVLVADDHEITRRGMRELISEAFQEAEIIEAGDAKDVRHHLPTRSWNLILLDVRMPGGTILELIEDVRTKNSTVPILVLTAVTEVEYAIQTMKAGANGFIQKHHAAEELLSAIEAVTSGQTYLHSETQGQIAEATIHARDQPLHFKLSERELDILRAIASGQSVKEVGSALYISEKTVATHISRIRSKTGLRSYVDMARYALRHSLVD